MAGLLRPPIVFPPFLGEKLLALGPLRRRVAWLPRRARRLPGPPVSPQPTEVLLLVLTIVYSLSGLIRPLLLFWAPIGLRDRRGWRRREGPDLALLFRAGSGSLFLRLSLAAFPLPLLDLLHGGPFLPFLPFLPWPLPLFLPVPLSPIFPVQMDRQPARSGRSGSLATMKTRLLRLAAERTLSQNHEF